MFGININYTTTTHPHTSSRGTTVFIIVFKLETKKIKSKCGIAQLSLYFLSYFPAAAYVQLVELINLNNLLEGTTFLLLTNQSS